jgi:hypothetical protein
MPIIPAQNPTSINFNGLFLLNVLLGPWNYTLTFCRINSTGNELGPPDPDHPGQILKVKYTIGPKTIDSDEQAFVAAIKAAVATYYAAIGQPIPPLCSVWIRGSLVAGQMVMRVLVNMVEICPNAFATTDQNIVTGVNAIMVALATFNASKKVV